MTPEEELTETIAALRACLSAQSYGLRGRSVQRAEYNALTKRIDELRRQIADSSSGPMFQLMQRVDVE